MRRAAETGMTLSFPQLYALSGRVPSLEPDWLQVEVKQMTQSKLTESEAGSKRLLVQLRRIE